MLVLESGTVAAGLPALAALRVIAEVTAATDGTAVGAPSAAATPTGSLVAADVIWLDVWQSATVASNVPFVVVCV